MAISLLLSGFFVYNTYPLLLCITLLFMTLWEFKQYLHTIKDLNFILPNGDYIPHHFHITEIGLITKQYIDCGWVERNEQVVSMQIRVAWDTEHRLSPQKLLKIIQLSESFIKNESLQIEFEYQENTIGKFSIDFTWADFQLKPLFTNCLAQDKCGIQPSQIPTQKSCCWWGCC